MLLEPSVEMIFRPEEEHRASREADIGVPPIGREEVCEPILRRSIGPVSRSTSSCNRASQSAHIASTRADWPSADGIPNMSQRAVGPPAGFRAVNSKAPRHRRERAGHPDLATSSDRESPVDWRASASSDARASSTVIDISVAMRSAVGGAPNSAMCV